MVEIYPRLPRPWTVEVSVAELMYESCPRPRVVDVIYAVSVPIVEIYPKLPRPWAVD